MNTESNLDTLEPKYIPSGEEGPLTQVPNRDRFESGSASSHHKGETREALKRHVKEIAHKAQEGVKHRADEYVNSTSSHIREVESVTKNAADQLRENQPDYIAGSVDYVADRICNVAEYFEHRDSSEILEDARRVIRDHPATALAGLAVAGFMAGRFLKATDEPGAAFREPGEL